MKLLEMVLPSSVALHARIRDEHPSIHVLGNDRNASGFVVEPGLVLTVSYALMGAREVEVATLDNRVLPGRVVAQDLGSGLAVVAIDDQKLPALAPAAEAVQPGQEVFILAALAQNTRRVHDGMVSYVGPFEAFWEYAVDRAVTTTATNPGFGGGALVNLRGHACAVMSLDLNEVGRFTMGVPIQEYVTHRDELLRYGRRVTRAARAWVGFFCYGLNDHVVIAGVLPGTPGEQAGLQPGDIVLSVDDRRIGSRRELYEQIWTHAPGEAIPFRVFRDNTMKSITVQGGDIERFFA